MCRSDESLCRCCGEPERFYECHSRCLSKRQCELCAHCIDHHHRNCTEELRKKAEEISLKASLEIANLRENHEINIFEYGVGNDQLQINKLKQSQFRKL